MTIKSIFTSSSRLPTKYSKSPLVSQAKVIAIPRPPHRNTFNTEVENFHGRMAMLGLVGITVTEKITGLTLPQQIVHETGFRFMDVSFSVACLTGFFILRALNPKNQPHSEEEVDTLSSPGFTPETELLHGRIAMLGFAYIVLAEAVKNHALF